MAQIIKHRRGSISALKDVTANVGELVMATGSIGDLNAPVLFIGDSAVAGGYKPVSKIYQGASAPVLGASYGSTMDGTPFYSNQDQTLYILDRTGNIDMDLTGNIEGNLISGVTINALTASYVSASADISAINITASYFTGDGSKITNISMTGVTGLDFSKIYSGSATASISPDNGLSVNVDTHITGALSVNGTVTIENYETLYVNNIYGSGSDYLNIVSDGNMYINSYDYLNVEYNEGDSGLYLSGNSGDAAELYSYVGDIQINAYYGNTAHNVNISGSNQVNITGSNGVNIATDHGSALNMYADSDIHLYGDNFGVIVDSQFKVNPYGYSDVFIVEQVDTYVNNRFHVNGNSSFTGSMTVSNGAAVINTGLISQNSDLFLTSGSNLIIQNGGNAQIAGDLAVTGSAYIQGDLQVTGSIYTQGSIVLSGSINIGDNIGVDTINFNGEVSSSILPKIDATFDLGSSGLTWNNLWAQSAHFTDITVPGLLSKSGSLLFTGLTETRVVTVGESGSLVDYSGFTFDGNGTGYNSTRSTNFGLHIDQISNMANNNTIILDDSANIESLPYHANGDMTLYANYGALNLVSNADSVNIYTNDGSVNISAKNGSNAINMTGSVNIDGRISIASQYDETTIGVPNISQTTDRITLWGGETAGGTFGYSLGVEDNHMWFGVDIQNSVHGFKWYAAGNELASLDALGNLYLGDVQGGNGAASLYHDGAFIIEDDFNGIQVNSTNGVQLTGGNNSRLEIQSSGHTYQYSSMGYELEVDGQISIYSNNNNVYVSSYDNSSLYLNADSGEGTIYIGNGINSLYSSNYDVYISGSNTAQIGQTDSSGYLYTESGYAEVYGGTQVEIISDGNMNIYADNGELDFYTNAGDIYMSSYNAHQMYINAYGGEGDINVLNGLNKININGVTNVTGAFHLTDSGSVLDIVGNSFSQVYLTTNNALVLNPGYGGVEIVGGPNAHLKVNDYLQVGNYLQVSGATSVTGAFTVGSGSMTSLGGDLYVSGNLQVLGSSTNVNLQSHTVDIGDNIILVNAYSPFQRYAGIAGFDSGSVGNSGSLLWDSLNNYWNFVNGNGDSSKIIGTTTGSLGNEISLTSGTFPIASGENTIENSLLTYSGTTLQFNTNKFTIESVSGNTYIAGNVTIDNGGTDNGAGSSWVTFRNDDNILGFVDSTDTQDVTTQLLGYDATDGTLKFSSVVDGGLY